MRLAAAFAALLLTTGTLLAQPVTEKGKVERHTVRGRSLEGNLAGDSPDRRVSVYLPPSYQADPEKRFPVVYMLHGFTDSESKWMGHEKHWINLPEVVDRYLASEDAKEVIVVMPDAFTKFSGSFYSRSVTTGDWETFIFDELVDFVDSHYRTIPDRDSRGLAGHSMGGYGAIRIGMKHPDVFGSVYGLSPCCLGAQRRDPPPAGEEWQVDSFEELAQANFGVKAFYALAAAWAPDPTNPPFFIDLPAEDGEPRLDILAKMAANAPIAMLDQYILQVESLNGLAFDAGDQDKGIAAAITTLDKALEKYGVEREFEIYEGDHINRVAERIETKTMPFFAEHLVFDEEPEP